jgi:putative restriction endonuclease
VAAVERAIMEPTWETLIAGLGTWTRGAERALHKPLLVLMILGRAQRGGPANVFRFRDLDEPLREALQAFGPARKSYRSELPFWRLKEDGFWVVHHEARLAARTRGGAPTRRLLLDEDAAAEVPVARWEELRAEPGRVARLVQTVLQAYWPAELRGRVAAEVVFGLRVEEELEA